MGEWKADKKHGKGTMTWPDNKNQSKKQYEGEWFEGNMAGKGIFSWGDG